MAIFFAFFNFLFYRIMSAAMFDDPLTIWASALTAIVVTIVMAFAGPLGLAFAFGDDEGSISLTSFTLVTIAACGVSCLVAYLIALGFSERLFDDLSHWSRYRELWEQDLFWFCIMISIPVIVHLAFLYRQFGKLP